MRLFLRDLLGQKSHILEKKIYVHCFYGQVLNQKVSYFSMIVEVNLPSSVSSISPIYPHHGFESKSSAPLAEIVPVRHDALATVSYDRDQSLACTKVQSLPRAQSDRQLWLNLDCCEIVEQSLTRQMWVLHPPIEFAILIFGYQAKMFETNKKSFQAFTVELR